MQGKKIWDLETYVRENLYINLEQGNYCPK